MSDELLKLPFALRLSRATLRNVKTNVAISMRSRRCFWSGDHRLRDALDGGARRHRRNRDRRRQRAAPAPRALTRRGVASAHMIQIKNLVKQYGEVSAVNDISLEVQAGEIFAFLGPNGAGKTTTIKMLTTLSRRRAGDPDRRPGSDHALHRCPTPVRHRLSGSQPRPGADRVREHGAARRALWRPARGPPPAHRSTC